MYDTAIYHCQQAVEKALKAMLVWHDDRITKSHDLTDLLESLLSFVPELEKYRDFAELLTPYARACPQN